MGENAVIEPGTITLNILPKCYKPAIAVEFTKAEKEYIKLGVFVIIVEKESGRV